MEDWRKRRPLPAGRHVGGAEIPDDRTADRPRQPRPVADLMRASPCRIMRQGLSMEAHQIRPVEPRQKLNMSVFDDTGRFGHARIARPAAKRSTQNLPFGACVGTVAAAAEAGDGHAVCDEFRSIDSVE